MACAVAAVAQIVTLLATSALSTPPAVAADMTVPPPPVVARPLWSGFYIGLQGGWGGGSTRITDPTMSITFQQLSYMTSGPLYGAQMGADWQFGNFVVGGELEAAAATIKGNSAFDPVFPLSGSPRSSGRWRPAPGARAMRLAISSPMGNSASPGPISSSPTTCFRYGRRSSITAGPASWAVQASSGC
jgi:opacity protein-like surface antigen